MTRPSETVVLAVQPRLLGDVLADALVHSGIDVRIHLPDAEAAEANGAHPAEAPEGPFRVAVVTGELADRVDADIVIRVGRAGQEPAEVGRGRVIDASAADLDRLVDLVRGELSTP